jgi:outer membrane protein assembly factor BamA
MPRIREFLARLALIALLAGLCDIAFAQDTTTEKRDPIISIEIEGNEKTIEQVIKQELVIKEGAKFDPDDIELSRQNIMDMGLFRSVEAATTTTPEGVEVTFVVDEKRFWYLVPVFSRGSDGDITWGARLQMDNLFGKNNNLTLRAKKKKFKDTDIQTENTIELEYSYPRIFGSVYDFGIQFDYDEADIAEQRGTLQGDYYRERFSVGFKIFKWLMTTGPSKGYRMALGIRSDDYDHEFLGGDPNLFTDLRVNSLIGGMEYINVVDHGAYRTGSHYGFQVEAAASAFGSDAVHALHNLFYRKYNSLDPDKRSNLNIQARFGNMTESIFGDATFQVTGGTAIRGYRRDSIEGDTFYIANFEYLRGIRNRENLRWVGFVDLGNAFEDLVDLSISDPKVGAGMGLRWKIRSFVRTDLRLDIAQGLGTDGDTRIYAGTHVTF